MKPPGGNGIWATAGTLGIGLLLSACITLGSGGLPPAPPASGQAISVQSAPIPLDPTDLSRAEVDGFRYAGGVVLTSSDSKLLHGVSDLVLSPGGRITGVSDVGQLLSARIVLDGAGRLSGLTDASIRPLLGEDGQPFPSSDFWDAEGLTVFPGGDMLVSFEQTHRIWRYPRSGGLPTPVPSPQTPMSNNDGMEGLAAAPTIARDGYWVGIETGAIWFCRVSTGCAEETSLPAPPAGMRLSGLTTGPGGELVILHHVYRKETNSSRIEVTVVRDPKGAKRVIGHFALDAPANTENFEGIAAGRKPNGDWRLYLIVDDNFSAGQRMLMTAFDWTPPK